MSYVVNVMLGIIDFIYGVTSSWGLAIIGLTLLVRVLLLPITVIQTRSMQKMAIVTPEQQRLQKKYKDDPDRLNLEIMELYREHKVNPATSCLAPLLPFPVIIAMIRALGAHTGLQEAHFLGIALGQPAPWFLAVLAIGSTYLAMRLSPTMGAGAQQDEKTQKMMTIFMLGMMALFAFRYQAALSIYIISGNIFGTLERFVVPRPEVSAKGAKAK